MTKQQKIQAAIDALPHVTPGEWRNTVECAGRQYISDSVASYDTPQVHDSCDFIVATAMTDGRDGPVIPEEQRKHNATLMAGSKDLAEEVVRLRTLVKEAFRNGHYCGGDIGSWAEAWELGAIKKDLEA